MSNIILDYVELIKGCSSLEPSLKEYKQVVSSSFITIYALLLVTDGYYFLLFLVIGFGIGGFYFNNKDGMLNMNYERSIVFTESSSLEFSNSSSSLEPTKEVELFYPPLTIVVNQLLDHVMRDFVLSWWTPINQHHDIQFERFARERLNVVFLNIEKILLNQERNDIVMSTVYGVANTLIIHMRECRALEDSELSINQYILENPQSPFSQLLSKEEQHRQLRTLSQTFLKRTLPAQDRDSSLLMSLFKEILATFVFGSILDNLSDPDILNCWIIELLSEKNNKTTEAIASAVLADNVLLSKEDEHPVASYQVTPPSTPEPVHHHHHHQRSNTELMKPNGGGMVFSPGSVHFTIMDISAPQQQEEATYPDKSELVYIIQIERPAMEDHAGSEGGGYVITRTYLDFETFNAILYARHYKRATKLQLRLPLEPPKSWLKTASSQQKKFPLDAISQALEKYIDAVVQDIELGTDPIILSFLRKERRSEIGNGGTVVSFSQEFKDEAISLENNGKSKSLFSRNSIGSLKSDEGGSEPWFNLKTRNGSVSSIQSNSLSPTDDEEMIKSTIISEPEEMAELPNMNKSSSSSSPTIKRRNTSIHNKALSAMDVELLIETTYALIVEIFNLTSTNNKAWMRRSILNLLREIVRRTYAEFISEQYSDFVNEYMSPDAIVNLLNKLGDEFWPEGKWMLDTKEQTKRTEEDKEKSRELARSMLMTQMIPTTVRQLIGDQNCNTAMDRIWARLQNTELNRVLILQVIERIVKPILG